MIKKLKAFIEILKPPLIPYGIAMALAAAMLTAYSSYNNLPGVRDLALIVIGVNCGISSAYAFNDYLDAEIDKINFPNRPIPSGILSRTDVLVYSVILFIIAAIIAYYFNPETLIVFIIAGFFINAYSSFLRRYYFSPLISSVSASLIFIGVGLAFNPAGFLKPNGDILPFPIILLALWMFFANNAHVLSDASGDIEGDRKFGKITMAVKFGLPFTSKIVLFNNAAAILIAIILGYAAHLGIIYWIGSLVGGLFLLKWGFKFVQNPIPDQGDANFLKEAIYWSIFYVAIIIDLLFCVKLPQYPIPF